MTPEGHAPTPEGPAPTPEGRAPEGHAPTPEGHAPAPEGRAADSERGPLRVTQLFLHPIKSCAANEVDAFELDERGPAGDRRWVVTDLDGAFLSQRKDPAMATIRVAITTFGLRLDAPGVDGIDVAEPADGAIVDVKVWGASGGARDAGDEAADWVSGVLGRPARLLHQAATKPRRLNPKYAVSDVSFADVFPLLILGASSIEAAAAEAGVAPDARRFRPNIVIGGAAPFAEDRWRRIRVGGVEVSLQTLCSRCQIINVDPDTGVNRGDMLTQLIPARKLPGGVMVGVNAVHLGRGTIRVGDPVEVIEEDR